MVAVFILILALWKKELFLKASYVLFGIGWVAGIVSYLTGEGAEDVAQDRLGHAIRSAIHEHEDMAFNAMITFTVVILVLSWNHFKPQKFLIPLAILLGLLGSVLIGYAGHLGGNIVYNGEEIIKTAPTMDPNMPMPAGEEDEE
jgi:uncharacterized membrane protein